MQANLKIQSSNLISNKILCWYDKNKRILPWRFSGKGRINPYKIWISEIMLQQTTVNTVVPFFNKFVKKWPGIEKLSNAKLDDVIIAWQGLGYYSRARNIYKTAQILKTKYNYKLPTNEAELLLLPGVGKYTAAAILSMAYKKKAIPIDANVKRVISRIYAIKSSESLYEYENRVKKFSNQLFPKIRNGDFAQALMDFGSIICIPKNPKCNICFLSKQCLAYRLNLSHAIPKQKKIKISRKKYGAAFIVINNKNELILRKENHNGVFANMMEIPSSLWQEKVLNRRKILQSAPMKLKWKKLNRNVIHSFSHFSVEIEIYTGKIRKKNISGKWVKIDNVHKHPISNLVKKIVAVYSKCPI